MKLKPYHEQQVSYIQQTLNVSRQEIIETCRKARVSIKSINDYLINLHQRLSTVHSNSIPMNHQPDPSS